MQRSTVAEVMKALHETLEGGGIYSGVLGKVCSHCIRSVPTVEQPAALASRHRVLSFVVSALPTDSTAALVFDVTAGPGGRQSLE